MTKKDEKGRIILGDNMKSKDKKRKYIKIALKNIIISCFFSIIILFTFMFSMLISNIISEVKVNLEEFKNELYYEDELYSTYSINEDIKLNDRVIKVDKVEKDKVNEIYTPKEGNELIFITISTKNISIYDISKYPHYDPNVRCYGLYIEDAVHFTPEVNLWAATEIIREYSERHNYGL